MIFLKTEEQIERMRAANMLVARTLGEVAKCIAPGVTTLQLDQVAEQFIRDNGGVPGFKGYGGFPYTLCTSVNEVVVHGFPSDYALKDGDIVSVDCGAVLDGFNGDSCYTFPVGEVAPETLALLRATKESLYVGIETAVEGKRIGDISAAIQEYCESRGYSVVREMCGHGIGHRLHEDPQVPNFGRPGTGNLVKNGLCIAIEPMINLGEHQVILNGWKCVTRDGKPSAHFEHTIAIRNGKADILSSFSFIEEALKDKSI